MIIKVALASVAAAALCAPAMAPAAATSSPAVSTVAFSVPMKHHNNNCHSLLLNVCSNSVQVPVQACGNNIANNIGLGLLGGKGSAKGGNNKSSCKQSTKSKH